MQKGAGGSALTLLVGVGNPLRGDDGVGVHVVRRLRERGLPDGCVAEELHGGWLNLLDRLHSFRRVVVVDALDAGLEPGTVVEVELPSDGAGVRASAATGHALGLAEILALARETDPRRRAVVTLLGIQVAGAAGFSEACSAPVGAALEGICESVRSILEEAGRSAAPRRPMPHRRSRAVPRILLLVLAAVIGAGGAWAQGPRGQRADFTGTWALTRESGDDAASKLKGEPGRSTPAGELGAALDLPLEAFVDVRRLVIADDGVTVRVTYPSGRQRVFRTDGEERVLDEGDGFAKVTVRRKGERGERIQVVGRWSDGRSLKETWELFSSPRHVVVTGKAEGRQSLRFERRYEPTTELPPSPTPSPTATPLPAPSPAASSSPTPPPAAAPGPAAAAAAKAECSIRPKRGTRQPELAALARLPQEEAARRATASVAPRAVSSVITSDVEVRDGCLVWPIVLRIPEEGGAREVLIDAGDGKVISSTFESLGKPAGGAPRP